VHFQSFNMIFGQYIILIGKNMRTCVIKRIKQQGIVRTKESSDKQPLFMFLLCKQMNYWQLVAAEKQKKITHVRNLHKKNYSKNLFIIFWLKYNDYDLVGFLTREVVSTKFIKPEKILSIIDLSCISLLHHHDRIAVLTKISSVAVVGTICA
ncbi:hypothetical protein ACJX0J_010718, partial [Zea mays]